MADPKQKARKEIERSQVDFQRAQQGMEKARDARRESFERGKAAGLSLAEIGKAAGLHRSRVDQVLHGK